jgi:hypothetical protein
LPVSTNTSIKKDTHAIIPAPQIETASVLKKIIQKGNPEAIKKDTITNHIITADNTITGKNYATAASLKPRKTKTEKTTTDYNMFRAGGF